MHQCQFKDGNFINCKLPATNKLFLKAGWVFACSKHSKDVQSIIPNISVIYHI